MNEKPFRLWSRNFILMLMANSFYFGSFYCLLPAMPQYVVGLGGTQGQVGLVMACFTLASVVFRPHFGQLSDRYGRKKIMLLGSCLFALFPGSYYLIQTTFPLYVARTLHGIAHAAFMAASSAYIADLAPANRRGEVIGLFGLSSMVAMAIVPALAIAIVKNTDGFGSLFMTAVLTGLAGFIAVFFVREASGKSKTASTGVLAMGKRREVLVPSLALASGATAYGAVLTFLPLYAPERGLPDFGLFFSAYAISTFSSRLVVGPLSDRLGREKVLLPFMAVAAIPLFMLSALNSLWMLGLVGICFGLGFGAFMPTLNALVVDKVSPHERGNALGFFTSFMDVGITAGALVMGAAGAKWGYGTMFCLTGFVVLAGMVMFAVYNRSRVWSG